ncbi:hypothetical protein EAH79_06445 [Sphingomonas koreensis]|nr:hypothetical protein EAH79_06445 [Sphingomonas koreensis]
MLSCQEDFKMSITTRIASSALAAVIVGTLVSAAAPAIAADGKITVTMPASALQDPAAKICLPSALIGKSKDPTPPKTVCQTRDVWATQGVNVVAKK